MKNAKILLVEDDSAIQEMYQLKFSQEGNTVLVARDGEEGLQLAQSEQPNVILLDVIMPKLDGFAVLEKLRNNPVTKDIPVVMLSNLGQQADVEKGKAMGAADYIIKASLTPSQVYDKISTYIRD